MMTENNVREKFENWANEQNYSLTRHPHDNEYYYSREVSMLWVAFSTGYVKGQIEENSKIQNILNAAFSDEEF